MVNILVQKWRVEGEKDLYSSGMEAMKGRKPGTIIEPVIVIEEVPDPEDLIKTKREEAEKKAKEPGEVEGDGEGKGEDDGKGEDPKEGEGKK